MFKKNIIKDTYKRSKWQYMVQREALLSTPECQEGVPSRDLTLSTTQSSLDYKHLYVLVSIKRNINKIHYNAIIP